MIIAGKQAENSGKTRIHRSAVNPKARDSHTDAKML
jgi:hypothetical protein